MKIKKRIFIVGIVTVMLISCLMPQSVHAYTGIELVAKDSTPIFSGVDGFDYIAPVGTEINLKYRGVGQNHEWSTAPSYTGTLPDGLSLVPEESQEEPFFYIKGTVVNATSGDLKATLNFTSIDNVTATSDMSFKVDKARPTISGSNILDRASGLKSSMTVDVTIANAYFGGSTPVMTSWRAKIRTGSGQDVWSDYSTATDSNVSFTFPADQLNLLPVGGPYDIYAIFEGNDNNWGLPFTKIGTFTVTAPIDASVTSATANFDKYAPADVIITKNDGSYTLASVKNGTATLVSGTDYTINGDTITVGKDYLSSLPNGNATLTFDYGMSTNPTVDITVADSTPTRNIHMTQSTGGTVAVSPESGKVGDTITVTATPDSGYYLKNIMVDGQAITGTTFVMKDADAEVSADFAKIELDKIEVTTKPTKMDYTTGELFDPAGMIVTATYTDGHTAEVKDYTYTPTDVIGVNDGKVVVTYVEDGITKTSEFDLNVTAALYSISCVSSTKGSVSATPSSTTEGQTVTVTATPAKGYYSNGILVNGKKISGNTFVMPGGNVEVSADFAKIELDKIEITTMPTKVDYTTGELFDPAGMIVTATYTDGHTAEVKDYTYTPTDVIGVNDGKVVVTYVEDGITKTSEFDLNVKVVLYSVSCASSTKGSVSATPSSTTEGQTVTVTATPAKGYYSNGILVNGKKISGNTFVMPRGNVEVSADFRIYTYDIKASASPTAGGTITGTGTVEYGKDVTLEVKAASGYTFSKWTENGKDVGKEAKLTIEDVQANHSYVAVFTKNTTTTKTNTTNGNTTNKTTVVTTTAAKTGDETNLMLYCMLMVLAVGTMITMIAIRKRRAR